MPLLLLPFVLNKPSSIMPPRPSPPPIAIGHLDADCSYVSACRAPSDEAVIDEHGGLVIFADWLEAQGQHGYAARIREVHQLLAPPQG